jgi:phosphatidylserine synthase
MKKIKAIYKAIISNPITTLGGVICCIGVVFAFLNKVDNAVALIGAGGTIIGLGSKDGNNNNNTTTHV